MVEGAYAYRFDDFVLDLLRKELRQKRPDGQLVVCDLNPQCVAVLAELLEHPKQFLDVDHFADTVFPQSKAMYQKELLKNNVWKVKKALGSKGTYIENQTGMGYRFNGPVVRIPASGNPAVDNIVDSVVGWLLTPEAERGPSDPYVFMKSAIQQLEIICGTLPAPSLALAMVSLFDPARYGSLDYELRSASARGLLEQHRERKDSWALIPAGEFRMGASKSDPHDPNYDRESVENEWVAHDVALDSFYIARYPTTVSEYQAFMKQGGYDAKDLWDFGRPKEITEPLNWGSQTQSPFCPVVGVSWVEAAAYCKWAGVRLATEAEWERAARGPEGFKFPWGPDDPIPGKHTNSHLYVRACTPVGIYHQGKTKEEVFDLLGNAWEWCQDWYELGYAAEKQRNPKGPSEGVERIVRGGSWGSYPGSIRASCRFKGNPNIQWHDVGFRCAKYA